MTLDQLRKMLGKQPHSSRIRRALHFKVLGRIARRDPDLATGFVREMHETCVQYSLSADDVLGWSKNHHSVAPARRFLWAFAHEMGIGYNESAALLGSRNHSTAIRAVRTYYAAQGRV